MPQMDSVRVRGERQVRAIIDEKERSVPAATLFELFEPRIDHTPDRLTTRERSWIASTPPAAKSRSTVRTEPKLRVLHVRRHACTGPRRKNLSRR